MTKLKLAPLVFANNWESHEYRADGKLIESMKHVYIKDAGEVIRINVYGREMSVPYNDMGIIFYATSIHYFVKGEILGTKIEYPLDSLIEKKRKFFVDPSKTKFK